MTHYDLSSDDGQYSVDVVRSGEDYEASVSGRGYTMRLKQGAAPGSFVAEFSDKPVPVTVVEVTPQRVELVIGGARLVYRPRTTAVEQRPSGPLPPPKQAGVVAAPMPGKVTGALVQEGEQVKAGDPLVMIESMKMEVAVRADRDGEVAEILVKEGEAVKRGQGLVRLR